MAMLPRLPKCGLWFSESNDSGPTLIDISAVRHLCQFATHRTCYAPLLGTTHLKRHQLSLSIGSMLQEPISMFFSLQAANDPPRLCLVSHRQGDGLCTILSDAMVVMLLGRRGVR